MVFCRCGVGVDDVITTALSRRIGGVEGVSWSGAGSLSVSLPWQNERRLLPE